MRRSRRETTVRRSAAQLLPPSPRGWRPRRNAPPSGHPGQHGLRVPPPGLRPIRWSSVLPPLAGLAVLEPFFFFCLGLAGASCGLTSKVCAKLDTAQTRLTTMITGSRRNNWRIPFLRGSFLPILQAHIRCFSKGSGCSKTIEFTGQSAPQWPTRLPSVESK